MQSRFYLTGIPWWVVAAACLAMGEADMAIWVFKKSRGRCVGWMMMSLLFAFLLSSEDGGGGEGVGGGRDPVLCVATRSNSWIALPGLAFAAHRWEERLKAQLGCRFLPVLTKK